MGLWNTASPVGMLWTLPSQLPPSSCRGEAGHRPMWQAACPCLGRKCHLQDCKFLAFTEHVQCHPLPVSLKGLMSRPQASPGFCASEWGQDSPQERQPHKVGKAREVADLGLIQTQKIEGPLLFLECQERLPWLLPPCLIPSGCKPPPLSLIGSCSSEQQPRPILLCSKV